MGVPGKKGTERVFEEIMAKDCPNLMKNTNLYIAEAQQTTKDKVKEITPGHIIIKLSKNC